MLEECLKGQVVQKLCLKVGFNGTKIKKQKQVNLLLLET